MVHLGEAHPVAGYGSPFRTWLPGSWLCLDPTTAHTQETRRYTITSYSWTPIQGTVRQVEASDWFDRMSGELYAEERRYKYEYSSHDSQVLSPITNITLASSSWTPNIRHCSSSGSIQLIWPDEYWSDEPSGDIYVEELRHKCSFDNTRLLSPTTNISLICSQYHFDTYARKGKTNSFKKFNILNQNGDRLTIWCLKNVRIIFRLAFQETKCVSMVFFLWLINLP